MKKNIVIKSMWLLALPVLVGVGGCKKYLDRKPLQESFGDWNGAQQLDGLSYAMYNTAQTYAGLTTLPWLDFNSIRDDDAQKGSSSTDGGEINAEFETFQYTKDDWATDT